MNYYFYYIGFFIIHASFIPFNLCKVVNVRKYEDEKLTRFLVDKNLSAIFVGAENLIAKLDFNLNKTADEFILTKEVFNQICSHETCSLMDFCGHTADDRKDVVSNDSDNELLLKLKKPQLLRPVFSDGNFVFICGFFNTCIVTNVNLKYRNALCNVSSMVSADANTTYIFFPSNDVAGGLILVTSSSTRDLLLSIDTTSFDILNERELVRSSNTKLFYNRIIYSFVHGSYLYNIVIDGSGRNGNSSYVLWACLNNKGSTVMMPLQCSVGNSTLKLVNSVVHDGDDIYAMFEHSRVCHITVNDIQLMVEEALRSCFQKGEEGFTELNFFDISSGKKCVGDKAHSSLDSYCDLTQPVYSTNNITMTHVGDAECFSKVVTPLMSVGSKMVMYHEGLFILCPDDTIKKFTISTENEVFKKKALMPSLEIIDYAHKHFPSKLESNIIQVQSGLNDEILILSANSLVSMKIECAQYTSCEKCVQVSSCAWCFNKNICSLEKECSPSVLRRRLDHSDDVLKGVNPSARLSTLPASESLPTFLWLTTCITVLSTLPDAIAVQSAHNTSFKLEVSHLPALDSALKCAVESNDIFVKPVAVPAEVRRDAHGKIFVHCSNFSHLPTEFINRDDIMVGVMKVVLLYGNIHLASSEVSLFECNKFKSCSKCYSTNACMWCPQTHMCLMKAGAIQVCPHYTSSPSVNSILFKCPLLLGKYNIKPKVDSSHLLEQPRSQQELQQYRYLIPASTNTTIEIYASYLKDFQIKEGLHCMVGAFTFPALVSQPLKNTDMPATTTATASSANFEGALLPPPAMSTASMMPDDPTSTSDDVWKITCHVLIMKESVPKALNEMAVNIAWGKHVIENPQILTAEVYNCRALADSCGECLLLDRRFNCVFCDNSFCTHQCPVHYVHGTSSFCTNPLINSLEPPGAPLNSVGTVLTLNGINLPFQLLDSYVKVGEKFCNYSKQTSDLFLPAKRISCIVEPSSVDSSVPVTLASKYSVKSSVNFVFKNPDLLSLHPVKGPRSGNTSVTVYGNLLHYGSSAFVKINKKKVDVVWRNATELKFLTPPNDATAQVNVDVFIDGVMLLKSTEFVKYNYLDDPSVNTIDPQFSLLSGGNIVVIRGSNLKIVQHPQFLVHLNDSHYVSAGCKITHTSSFLECFTPDLSGYDIKLPANLHCGLIMDGVKPLIKLDRMIQYAQDPIITFFHDKPFVYDKQRNHILYIDGENLSVLHSFTDLIIEVGGAPCIAHKFINDSCIMCSLPDESKIVLDEHENAEVVVTLGNYKRFLGNVVYRSKVQSHLLMIIVITLAVITTLVVIIILLICYFRRRRNRLKNKKRTFLLKPADTSTTHVPLSEISTPPNNRYLPFTPPHHTTLDTFANGQSICDNKDDATYLNEVLNRMESVRLRNVARNVCIDLQQVQLLHLIGRGCFTRVHLASMKSPIANGCEGQTVCVKVIEEENLSEKMIDTIVRDASIMNNFRHEHVLVVMAICVGFRKEPWIVLPYMSNGDLRSYIKDKSKNFTARQLLQLAQQVAGGMAYLSNLNFVHRELAARNCLLDENLTVKVSDFGLTTELHEIEYFSNNASKFVRLPIKWMAIESLENFLFTTKSDVWSYGVLLWELMTRGVVPYPDLPPQQITSFLNSGKRLKKPKYCPPNVYAMMNDCWLEIPERRPTFTDLVNRLEVLLNPPKRRRVSQKEDDEPLYINARDNLSPSL